MKQSICSQPSSSSEKKKAEARTQVTSKTKEMKMYKKKKKITLKSSLCTVKTVVLSPWCTRHETVARIK